MLTLPAIHDLEERIMSICNSSSNIQDLTSQSSSIWDWACAEVGKPLAELRHEIENHETDEQFPSEFLEEKDHLLKLPLVLLEHFHRK